MLNLRPARLQAYRYGRQCGTLELHHPDRRDWLDAVVTAFTHFENQFSDDQIRRDHVTAAYWRGVYDVPIDGYERG